MKWEELKEKYSTKKKSKKHYIAFLIVFIILSVLVLKYECIISLFVP